MHKTKPNCCGKNTVCTFCSSGFSSVLTKETLLRRGLEESIWKKERRAKTARWLLVRGITTLKRALPSKSCLAVRFTEVQNRKGTEGGLALPATSATPSIGRDDFNFLCKINSARPDSSVCYAN